MEGMTTHLMALLVLALSAQEPTERDVRTWVLAYVDSKDEAKVREAMEHLRTVRPILAQKTLKSIFAEGKPARSAKAIDIALEMGVPGLWDSLSKQIDSPDEERIIKLEFQTQEPAAISALLQRWTKADTSSASFKFLESAMKSYGVADQKHLDTLKSFVAFNDSARAESATNILCAQLGVESKEEITKNYDDLKAEFLLYGKQLPIPGADLTSLMKVQRLRRVGANFKLLEGSTVELESLPEFLQSGPLIFSFEVFPIDGKRSIKFFSDSKGQKKVFDFQNDAKDWFVRTGEQANNLLTVPCRLKAWNKVEFILFRVNEAPHPCSRHIRVLIGGKTLLDNGCLAGDWSGIRIESTGTGYIGGFSAIKK